MLQHWQHKFAKQMKVTMGFVLLNITRLRFFEVRSLPTAPFWERLVIPDPPPPLGR